MTMPMITEREAIERERKAAEQVLAFFDVFDATNAGRVAREEFVAKQFPLPKVVRPRVVRDMELDCAAEFRVYEGRLEARDWASEARWGTEGLSGWRLDTRTIAFFADLLANPTELVDDA